MPKKQPDYGQLTARLRQRNRILTIHNRMMDAMVSSLHMEEILRRIIELVRKDLLFDRVGLFLFDSRNQTLQERIGTDFQGRVRIQNDPVRIPVAPESGPMGAMVTHKDSMFYTEDYFNDPRIDMDCMEARMSDPKVTQRAVFPLKIGNQIIGTMTIDNLLSGRRMSREKLLILEDLLPRVALALRNVLLFEEIEQANDQLKKLNHVKNNFLSLVSHELRTPLMIIQETVAQLVDGLKGPLNEAQHGYLMMCKRNSQRLSQIINDLLDISKIESGRIHLNRSLVDYKRLLEEVIGGFKIRAQKQKVVLKLKCCSLSPIFIDEDRIVQVITNLLANALKYTQSKGTITVEVKKTPSLVMTHVKDTGVGIEKSFIGRIFDPFEKGSNKVVSGEKSTGLGLAIAKDFVELHNGFISVKSVVGKGSDFHFALPLYQGQEYLTEVLKDEIDAARDDSADVSLLILRIVNTKGLIKELGRQKTYALVDGLFKHIKDMKLRNCSFYPTDCNEELALVANIDRDAARGITRRLVFAMNRYWNFPVMKEGVPYIVVATATYPQECSDHTQMLRLVRKKIQRLTLVRPKPLGEMLVDLSLITKEELQEALALQQKKRRPLGVILVDKGYTAPFAIGQMLQRQLGIPYAPLGGVRFTAKMMSLFSLRFMKTNRIIPLRVEKDAVVLGMIDPLNIKLSDTVATMTGLQVKPMIVVEEEFEAAMKRFAAEKAASKKRSK